MKVSDLVYEKIQPLFTRDITLVDVEYAKKNDGMHLTIYIEKESGVTVDDCVEVSRLIDEPLEELNPTNDEPYFLDISSYGLDKPLKYDWQYKKYYDKKVTVKLYRKIDDRKEFVAVLKAKDEETVTLAVDDENISINLKDVAYIIPYIEF
ncbi:MAG: ribosome maturation factor RimP [Clostridiales bacterium]|nr:ribosome maturation factor RimP [Clostridiales bacterium]